MLPGNKKHLKRVLIWGLGVSTVLALLSLVKFPPVVAASIVAGAALGIFNLYAIVKVVEALAGAAATGAAGGKASKAIAMMFHFINIAVIAAVLVALVWYHLINLFALLAGFTVVLLANLAAGLSGLSKDADKVL